MSRQNRTRKGGSGPCAGTGCARILDGPTIQRCRLVPRIEDLDEVVLEG